MSFFCPHPNGLGAVKVFNSEEREKDTGGFVRQRSVLEKFEIPNWWATEMLPPPLRHNSGHEGSHCFLTHEFVSALIEGRKPTVNVYEAVAYTAPGIVAHQSALAKGKQMAIPSFDA